MTVSEYVGAVVAGELRDPTLSFELRHGFEVRGPLRGYVDESASDDFATLIVWRNPDAA